MPDYVPFAVPSKAQVLGAGCTLSIGGITGVTGTPTFVAVGFEPCRTSSSHRSSVSTTTNTNFDSGQIVQKLGTTARLRLPDRHAYYSR